MKVSTSPLATSFQVSAKIESFYTGGKVALSSDGKFLACTHQDEILLVDTESTKVIQRLHHPDLITSFAIHPNDKELVSSARNLQLTHWDLTTGKAKRTWKAHKAPVLDMAFGIRGSLLATASADRTIQVWDVDKGYTTHLFRGHQGIVTKVLFHWDPHRLLLFSGDEEGSLRKWDLSTKRGTSLEGGHVSAITALCMHDKEVLVSAGRDKVVNVWNTRNNSLTKTIPAYEELEAMCMIKSSSSKKGEPAIVATGGERGRIRLWDTSTGKVIREEEGASTISYSITDLLENREKGFVAITSDQNILFYNKDLEKQKQMVGYNDEILDVKYVYPKGAPPRRSLLPVGQQDGASSNESDDSHLAIVTNSEQVRLVDMATQNYALLTAHSDIVLAVDVSMNGRFLATASKDNTVRLWDTLTKECLAVCMGHMEAVSAVAFAKRSLGFVISGSRDRTIKCWDVTDVLTARLQAGATDKKAEEVTIPSAKWTKKAHDKDINAIAVAPNDKIFATASQDKTIKIWDATKGDELAVLKGHRRGVWSIEFSPVDRCIASASADRTIKIWSLTDYTCLKTFEGHTNSVLKVSFLKSGMQMVSAGSDGLLKLWTIKTNECVNTFDAHTDKIWALAVHNNESQIVTGGGDSLINIWSDSTSEEEEKKAQEQEQKILQQQELSNSLRHKNWRKAVSIAFKLNMPYKLLNIFEQIMTEEENSEATINELIGSFSAEDLGKCLSFVRDWNTNARHCMAAQKVLQTVFSRYPAATLRDLPNMKELLEGLIPYTERHFQRYDKLLQKSFIVDYTLQAMTLLTGEPSSSSSINEIEAVEISSEGEESAVGDYHNHKQQMELVQVKEEQEDKEEKEREVMNGTKQQQEKKKRKRAESNDGHTNEEQGEEEEEKEQQQEARKEDGGNAPAAEKRKRRRRKSKGSAKKGK
ncbi:U3 small nucleolar RNA-associated protein 13 [Balamuthia mandrillaris]